jgi:hypothetical protein
MFGDDRFERAFLSESGCKLGADKVEMSLSPGFLQAFRLDHAPKLTDLFCDSSDALRYGFEFESKLATLSAEGFHLKVRISKFALQATAFAICAGEAFFSLGKLVAKARS